MSPMSSDPEQTLRRWRYVLGRFAQDRLPCSMSDQEQRIEQALDYLYGREYQGRGIRPDGSTPDGSTEGGREPKQPGSLDPSQLTIPTWITAVRELFPKETVEVIEKHALERYGLQELVTDPETLQRLTPNLDLLKTVLAFKGQMQGEVLQLARQIVQQVVSDLRQHVQDDIRRSLLGRLNRFRHSPLPVAQNLDWRGTLRRNLKHYDPEQRRLFIQDVRFFSRVQRRLPWHVILCIDQSGSMVSSVIHSAVMAGILAGLPSLSLSVIIFDTQVVDLSEHIEDPVEMLMSVQLGGGTDIGQALSYSETLVQIPHRTILILISDFCEGASPRVMLSVCKRLRESGVLLLGLASLDEEAAGFYDVGTAEQLAALGMEIAALTPRMLAEWLASKIF